MVNVSTAWNRELLNDNRNYLEYVDITLTDSTVLNLTNQHIWNGGFAIEDAVSSDSDFQVGSAIINRFTVCLNNLYGDFNDYVFEDARVSVRVGLNIGNSTEIIQKGKYIVENAKYNGDLITLECYDYMKFFDVPYSESTLTYPATLDTIVRSACTDIGVTLGTLDFPHKSFIVSTKPDGDATTYREIIAWAAQVAGCYARISASGQLELKWFDQASLANVLDGLDGGSFDSSTPYSTGDSADGGIFNPWNTGDIYDGGNFSWSGVHLISSLYSMDVSVDDVVITGVRILVKTTSGESGTEGSSGEIIKEYMSGQEGYVIEISENPFITTTNANDIKTWLATQLIGFRFRKATISHGSNPAMEAGDVAILFDRKGGAYPIVVSSTKFSVGSAQNTVSSAQAPARNSAARFSVESKNYVELRKSLRNERTSRQQIEAQLASDIENANGLYTTDVQQQGGGTLHYLHNKEELSDSDIRILVSDVGITVTANGTSQSPNWYGLTVNGQLIASILSAVGVNADWINAGQLVITDSNGNETFFADTTTGVVRIKASSFSLSGQTIADIAQTKADAAVTSANGYTDTKTGQAITAAEAYSDGKLADYKDVVDAIVNDLQSQIDGQIETFYYDYEPTLSNYPANEWTTAALKKEHEGDMFFWKSTGYSYRFLNDGTDQNPNYKWIQIQDTGVSTAIQKAEDALALAGVKRRIFTAQPVPPYDQKDLWVGGSTGDIKVCATSRATGSYVAADWVLASKYTDDSALATFISGDYASDINSIQGQIDGKVDTFYQSTDPKNSWASADYGKHIGDMWYNSTSSVQKYYRFNGSTWDEMKTTPPDAVFNQINKKAQIFVSQPVPPYAVGDLWVQGASGDIYKCITARSSGSYTASEWALASKYTDNTALNAFIQGDFSNTITDIQGQIDQKAETFYQSADPSINWTAAQKAQHVGDLWFRTTDNVTLRYGSNYQWAEQLVPTAVFDKIDTKKQIFTSQPVPPYDERDLWVQGSNGDIMVCASGIHRASGSSFVSSDWVKASKYTDNTALNAFKDGDYANFVTNTNASLGNKITTFYQNTAPTATVVGDLWIDTGDQKKLKRWTGSQWQDVRDESIQNALNAAANAKSIADRKIVTFAQVSQPTGTLDVGDLWISTSEQNRIYRYSGSAWVPYEESFALEAFKNGRYAEDLLEINAQVDNKAEIFYGTSAPTPSNYPESSWNTAAKRHAHKDDIYYNTTTGYLYRYLESGTSPNYTYSWVHVSDSDISAAATLASNASSLASGKATIFVGNSTPSNPQSGDLWMKSATDPILTYVNGTWTEYNKYTDDTVVKAQYGTCQTVANTAQKVVALQKFSLYSGARISVKFTYSNTAASPSLNVNGTGAHTIKAYGSALAANSQYNWSAGSTVDFVYDGSDWNISDSSSMAKAKSYVDTLDTSLNQQSVFNRLTNNGTSQGIYLENQNLYINANYIRSGALGIGGVNNLDGSIEIFDENNNQIGKWDKSGISVLGGSIGGWNIYPDGIRRSNGTIGVGMLPGTNQSGTFLYVVDSSGGTSDYKFAVFSNGRLNAKDAHISGGTIAGWDITSSGITNTPDLYSKVAVLNGTGTSGVFLYVADTSTSTTTYPFIVYKDGRLVARALTATNTVKITGSLGSFVEVRTQADTYTNPDRIRIDQNGFSIKRSGREIKVSSEANDPFGFVFTDGSTHPYSDPEAKYSAGSMSLRGFSGEKTVIEAGRIVLSKSGTAFYRVTSNEWYLGTNLTVTGKKPRLVTTKDYAERYLYCYETPSPMFGDVGDAVIGEDGRCYVTIDPVFAETVTLSQYQVFLQRYGQGDCYVAERKGSYFVVEGTPGLEFGWELKAKQADFDQTRLDRRIEQPDLENKTDYLAESESHIQSISRDYAQEAINHINHIYEEREIA